MNLSLAHSVSHSVRSLAPINQREPVMPMNPIQFQRGVSMPEFFSRYGTEAQCTAALVAMRWPNGVVCPRCSSESHYVVSHRARKLYQCRGCRHQTSLTAGTLLDSTKLPLTTWFLAIYLLSQDKTGLSSLALKRHLGTSYRTAWLIHHKLMKTMAQRDSEEPLSGFIQADDAYLGGEHPGTGGRGSPNKVPIVAAVAASDAVHPMRVKMSQVAGFTRTAIADWARANLTQGCDVRSDGLACFAGVIDAGCAHSYIVVGNRLPREMPQFTWVNTILGNLKTMISGAHKAFRFGKYASQYLGAFAYRFNRRVDMQRLLRDLIGHAATASPARERQIRAMAEVHD
jgi:transposase-like protein